MTLKRIVIIDPCESTRQLVTQVLGQDGYSVASADCCVYSNDLIYSVRPPDLIIMDVLLPMMRGDKKAQLLKAREKSRDIPILLIAARPAGELQALAVAAGAEGFLPKPFDAAQLLTIINHLLSCKRLQGDCSFVD